MGKVVQKLINGEAVTVFQNGGEGTRGEDGITVFSSLFNYNPVGWLCIFILIAGMLGSARIILRHHTLGEVLGGFVVGLVCTILTLDPMPAIFLKLLLNG